MPDKIPAIQLYTGDWMKDPVSSCSLAAQGLWLRMMFIMHDSERYGYLAMNGAPIPPRSVARITGCDSLEQYEALLAELDSVGVPSRTRDGIIFSRRMVRDAQKRESWKQQKRSQRNGNLSARCPQDVRKMSARSSSSSSSSISSSSSEKEILRARFQKFYSAYPVKLAPGKVEREFEKLAPDDGLLEKILSAIKQQIELRRGVLINGGFVPEWPNPANWLSDRRWEDEIVTQSLFPPAESPPPDNRSLLPYAIIARVNGINPPPNEDEIGVLKALWDGQSDPYQVDWKVKLIELRKANK